MGTFPNRHVHSFVVFPNFLFLRLHLRMGRTEESCISILVRVRAAAVHSAFADCFL